MKFNKTIIKIGIIVTILILLIGLPAWLFITITATDLPTTGINILLETMSFGYFAILMLCAGLASFWLALLLVNFGSQMQKLKTKIIFFVLTSPFVVALSIFFIKFTVLPLGRIIKKIGNV